MSLRNGFSELLRYKLRTIGWRETLRVGALDLTDNTLHFLGKRDPSRALSARSIQIECTTRCNLKCTMCEIAYWTEKGGDLRFDNLERMVEHLPGLRRVDLTGVGESLMNREFLSGVTYLKARGVYVTLNDNFTLMTERTARRIVDLGLDQILLSLDGATKATYESIRVGANFENVLANARGLTRIKRELGRRKPEFKINTVVSLTNYKELTGIVELARDLGVGMVSMVNIITFGDTAGLGTESIEREVRDAYDRAVLRGRELGVLVKIELFDKLPVEQCDFPWTRNFVTYDGYVHPCCYTTQTGDRQAQNRRAFGNLLERSFADIWQSEAYTSFRRKMKAGILPEACTHCPKYTGRPEPESVPAPGRSLPVLGQK
jgi:radical SAM protein with 4Fe4S-binding SPASM domain